MKQSNIRNFCIIAHIDHGKSTLADRFLEFTGTVEKRNLKSQTLDSMELEREKGITIKLKAVRMDYMYDDEFFELNLIDTPGHVDFSYEVSRSLAACEGAILVVDATQGIQAQTVSNILKATNAGLHIIPVINKIDLINAEVERVAEDLQKTFGFKKDEIIRVSAKTGEGVEKLFQKIILEIPSPAGNSTKPLRGLVFDTYYDDFLGVVAVVKIVDGQISNDIISKSRKIRFMATKAVSFIGELGVLKPQRTKIDVLSTGEVGYIATGLKDIKAVRVGDTVVLTDVENISQLPGYKEVKPFVFVSVFPVENNKFPELRSALEKLSLSDAALSYEPESSSALGFGFRCGFLGLLHADIIQERLEREYDLRLISTTPSVEYKIVLTDLSEVYVKSPADFPSTTRILEVLEPWILLTIISPSRFVGGIITLCEKRRGILKKMDYPSTERVVFEYELPLSELIYNFFDDLKSVSSGFASLDYDLADFRKTDVIKLDILVHGEIVSPLSYIVLREKAFEIGKNILAKLKEVIPKQQFQVSLQAAVGGKIIVRGDIPAMRKNVLAKMSGGHRERKDKLLDIQKKGKKRMKKFGKVDIPQEAFRQILSS